MERRDALKALSTLAGATGMTVTPVTVKDAEHVALVILKPKGLMSGDGHKHLAEYWTRAVEGTPLQDVRAVVVGEDIDVEFVRR